MMHNRRENPQESRDSGDSGDLILSFVREVVEMYVLHERLIDVGPYVRGPLKKKAGAFVSIKKEGSLRGCMGTVSPSRSNLAEELLSNAVSAVLRDPRFPPVEPHELPQLSYSVDILGDLEEVLKEELDPEIYGLLVERGRKRGLLLPNIKGIHTVEDQIKVACKKAGIPSLKGIRFYRFTVERFKE